MIKGLEGAAAEFLRDRYAGELTERETATIVGTTVSSIVESNPDRLGLLILNLSTDTVFVAIENNPSATNGIRLGANGGSVAFNVTDDGMIQTRAMFALSTGAASSVYVLELTRFIADRQITSQEDTPLTEAV
jgi:hypothetical protein